MAISIEEDGFPDELRAEKMVVSPAKTARVARKLGEIGPPEAIFLVFPGFGPFFVLHFSPE